jgi:hypothetical protein
MAPKRGLLVDTDESLPATTFDALIARMRRDVRDLEVREEEGRRASASRLQAVLDAAIHEARVKGAEVRETVGAGAEMLRAEMQRHPTASVSAAFAAGYLIGKSIVGRTRT